MGLILSPEELAIVQDMQAGQTPSRPTTNLGRALVVMGPKAAVADVARIVALLDDADAFMLAEINVLRRDCERQRATIDELRVENFALHGKVSNPDEPTLEEMDAAMAPDYRARIQELESLLAAAQPKETP